MAVASQIEVDWGGALRRFALPFAQLRALQAEVEVGPGVLLQQLGDAARLFSAMRATLRQGLEGGGLPFAEAEGLVHAQVDPVLEALVLARAILTAWSMSTAEALKATAISGRGKEGEADPSGRLDFGSYLQAAGAAGIQNVDAMDFADLIYLIDGWKKANCAPDKPPAPSVADHEAAKQRWAAMQSATQKN